MGFSLFKSRQKTAQSQLQVDIHSHLIFDVDDGSNSLETSLKLIKQFYDLGYRKIVTSPHIMLGYFNNTKETLFPKRDIIRTAISEELGINDLSFDCAAEYYLDEQFLKLIKKKENLLSLGNDYVLFETGFMSQPMQLNSCIFEMLSNGIKPILAHPERYMYLHTSIDKCHELKEKGVFLQLNINSLSGYYSKAVKKYAEKLIDENLIDFIGSDCHNQKQFDFTKEAINSKYYDKLMNSSLLNDTLL